MKNFINLTPKILIFIRNKIIRAIFAGFLGKGISILVNFLSIPIAINYLGNEGYGLYATITSVLGWLQISNLGVGLGLQNALTEAVALEKKETQNELINTAIFLLFFLSIITFIIILIISPTINWIEIFPSKSITLQNQTSQAVNLAIIIYIIIIFLSFVGPIYAAYQKLDYFYSWNALAQIAGLIGLIFATKTNQGLQGIILGINGANVVLITISAVWILKKLNLTLSINKIRLNSLRKIFYSGSAFFIIQISMLGIYQADRLIISQVIGMSSVTPYTVAFKLFSTFSLLISLALGPLWPAYGEAKSKGNKVWIEATHKKILKYGGVVYLGITICVLTFYKPIFVFWVGEEAMPSFILLLVISIYFLIKLWTDIFAILTNGLDIIKPQAISAIFQAFITVPGMVILGKKFGLVGIPLAGIIGFLFTSAWLLPYITKKYFEGVVQPK